MPTSYMLDLYNGDDITFQDFVMEYAEAFGKVVEVNDYFIRKHAEARDHYNRVNSWDNAEADRQAEQVYDADLKRYNQLVEERTKRRERYEAVLAQAEALTPPTKEHKTFRESMIAALKKHIAEDCDTEHLTVPARITGADYRLEQSQLAFAHVIMYSRREDSMRERLYKDAPWVSALKESLAKPPDA